MAQEMKDSGVAWIGEIPTEWKVERLARCLSEIKEKNTDCQNSNALQFKMGEIIRKHTNTATIKDDPEIFSAYTVVQPGAIIINGLNLEFDFVTQRVGLVKENGIITSAYIAVTPTGMVFPEYMCYLLKSYDYCKAFHSMGRGLRKILSYKELRDKSVLIPPFDEQKKIANYLNRKFTEIDAVLEKTRTSIEEYKKLKQAIITRAVTKGVRGDRPMKESGIEWADAIPEEIKVSRLGLHYDIILGKMLCSAQADDSYTLEPYYCAADVHFEGISDSERKMMWFSPAEKELYLVRRNDLLVVEGGAGAGGCAIVADEETPTYIQNSIMIVRAKHSGDCRYVRYWLECLVRQGYIDVVCNKATIPHFTKDKLAAVPYFVFSEEERNEIADYLDEQCKKIDALIQKKKQSFTELESYKKSLIYEYVTGKKEVQQKQQVKEVVVYPFFPAVFQATNPRFAQAILMSKVLDSCKVKMGRVKLEKIMFVLENSIGFDFDTEYVREAAGPLDKSIYECEQIISRKNKWFTIRKSQYGVSYKPTSEHSKYKKYYAQYFSDYEDAINKVISIFNDFDADQAEVIATLYGAWNDCIIDKRSYTDNGIVDEVLNHWHPKKRRFPKDMWLRAIQRMRELDLVPHGYGRHTIIKQN